MRFASPYYLLLLIPVAALVWLELRKKTGAVRFPDVSFLRQRQGMSRALKLAMLAIHTLALVCIVIALARPQRGRIIEDVESRGVDIVLCMDISESMLTGDLRPDRLTAAKQRAIEFIRERTGDRIGLVVFANGAMTLCPLTLDRAVLGTIIEGLRVGMIDGTRTAIGAGLASAVARLKDSAAKGKIVILLTDGIQNAGEIDPQTAAQLALSYGIKVYCIGVGSKTPTTVMVHDPFFGSVPRTVAADFDMKTLDGISTSTGAKAFAASDNEGLRQIYQEIARLEPTRFKTTRHTLYSERAGTFLLPGVALFLAGLAIPALLLRRLP